MSNNRVLLGDLDGSGSFGLRVSRPGYDADDLTGTIDEKLAFDSRFLECLHLAASGSGTMPGSPATQPHYGSVAFGQTFSAPPLVVLVPKRSDNGNYQAAMGLSGVGVLPNQITTTGVSRVQFDRTGITGGSPFPAVPFAWFAFVP